MANSAGDRFDSLLGLMARLRGDGGCPWDREQTRETLKPYLIEEAYEVLDAIDGGSNDHLIEELGDLLFQVVFHCQVAGERREFTMLEVLERLSDKMIRRHPHVFGDRAVGDAREALEQWERIKHEEGQGRRPVPIGAATACPPRCPPSCGRSDFRSRPAAWGSIGQNGARRGRRSARRWRNWRRCSTPGRLLGSVTSSGMFCFPWSMWPGCGASTPKIACAKPRAKFTRRFREVEAEMRAAGRRVSEAPAVDLDRAWEAVKAREQRDSPGLGAER